MIAEQNASFAAKKKMHESASLLLMSQQPQSLHCCHNWLHKLDPQRQKQFHETLPHPKGSQKHGCEKVAKTAWIMHSISFFLH